jgi:hypothetical protein
MTTPKDVAQWMLDEVSKEKMLHQEHAVYDIAKKFGDEFTYMNENGNLAISRPILRAFRKLSMHTVVWVRSERYWRLRDERDTENKRQVDY